MRERLFRYSACVCITGVVVAVLGLVTETDEVYYAGLVLALPAFIFYGAAAVFLVGMVVLPAIVLPVVAVVAGCRWLTGRGT